MSSVILSFILAIVAQLFNALIVLIDKHIVTRTAVSSPTAYAFYVASLSSVVLFMVPWGVVHMPDLYTIYLSLVIGLSFVISIVLLYSVLKIAATTDVIPWLVAISTVATFVFGSLFLNENLPQSFIPALALFVLSMFFVGHFRFNARSFFFIACSGVLFGASAVFLKVLFSHTSFADGFFWSRMGNVFGALLLLLMPSCRSVVFGHSRQIIKHVGVLIITNRILGGLAFLLTIYAIHLGSVSVVNALSSLQFLFVFVLIFLLRNVMSEQFEHEFRPGHVTHKVVSMALIIAGFLVLFIN